MPKKEPIKIIIEISVRHIHISQLYIDKLFGKGHKLTMLKHLSQSHEFAANEVLEIKTAKSSLKNVRVLGPARDYTQVEISKTDSFYLGLDPLIKISGDLEDTPGLTLVGPKGGVDIPDGVILSYRHIHCSPSQAKKYGLKHKQLVKVRIRGQRSLIFENVMVKVKDEFDWRMHIDTDEANAAAIDNSNNVGEVII
ncbi:MAG: phosphate propanoyltransferase [Patescibacteria group bacterium]